MYFIKKNRVQTCKIKTKDKLSRPNRQPKKRNIRVYAAKWRQLNQRNLNKQMPTTRSTWSDQKLGTN
jgi:hypothetical protein